MGVCSGGAVGVGVAAGVGDGCGLSPIFSVCVWLQPLVSPVKYSLQSTQSYVKYPVRASTWKSTSPPKGIFLNIPMEPSP